MLSRELVYLKSDAIERKLVGKIISRFEDAEFKIIRIKKGPMSDLLVNFVYPDSQDQLAGMGRKTIAAMTEKGEKEMIAKTFGTSDPVDIGTQLNIWNRRYAAYSEIIAMVLEGDDAANRAKELVGGADPKTAGAGTVRGDLGADSVYQANIEKRACRNLIHAAESANATNEIGYFIEYFFQ